MIPKEEAVVTQPLVQESKDSAENDMLQQMQQKGEYYVEF